MTFRRLFYVHPSKFGCSAFRWTLCSATLFKVDCTFSVSSSSLLASFVHGVSLVKRHVVDKLSHPWHSRCLAKGALQSLLPSHWHQCSSPECHCSLLLSFHQLIFRDRPLIVLSHLTSPSRSRFFGFVTAWMSRSYFPVVAMLEAGTSCTKPRVWTMVLFTFVATASLASLAKPRNPARERGDAARSNGAVPVRVD